VNTIAAVVRLIPRVGLDSARRSTPNRVGSEFAPMQGTPYAMYRELLLLPTFVPCTPPPFGALVGVDLRAGVVAWRVPLGGPTPGAPSSTGTPNLGGAITTAGGVTFIAATLDRTFRAFETRTGRELWQAILPAGGKATPMTYAADGRQFVVIAAGGNGGSFGTGDAIMAYALPVSSP
jgi:quinoprotein glucose dehydrogenase